VGLSRYHVLQDKDKGNAVTTIKTLNTTPSVFTADANNRNGLLRLRPRQHFEALILRAALTLDIAFAPVRSVWCYDSLPQGPFSPPSCDQQLLHPAVTFVPPPHLLPTTSHAHPNCTSTNTTKILLLETQASVYWVAHYFHQDIHHILLSPTWILNPATIIANYITRPPGNDAHNFCPHPEPSAANTSHPLFPLDMSIEIKRALSA
jgi:hypothetical protein